MAKLLPLVACRNMSLAKSFFYYLGLGKRSGCVIYSDIIYTAFALEIIEQKGCQVICMS